MGRPETLQGAAPHLWRVMRHFWPYIRRQRLLIALSFLALFAEIGLRLLEPWPLKFVIDRVLAPSGGGRSGIPAVDALAPMTLLTLAALAPAVIIGLRALAGYWTSVGFFLVGNRVLTQVRALVYRHLQGLSLSFHTKARSGDLIVRVGRDVEMLKDVAATAFFPLLGSALLLFFMAGLMFWVHWKLTLLALVPAPLFWLTTLRISRRIHAGARRQRQRESEVASTAAESIGAIKVVQALSLEDRFAQAFTRQNIKSQEEDAKTRRASASLERALDVLTGISVALVLWYGALLVLRGELTAGDLLVFLAYLKKAFHPLQDFAKYTGRLAKAAAAGERVLDLLERTPEVRDLPGAVPAPPFRGAVRFERVSFAYEAGQRVLDQIDFEAHPGQRIALVGPSGIGKSTLVSLILRLYDPLEGRVLIDGRDVRDYTLASLRAQTSMVLQDPVLFAASIRDNIAYGAPDCTPEEIEAAARLANAHEFITALPQGYDTAVGERGVTLSNGQRQRIAIARAAVRRAPLVILDEPTTSLDKENEQAVVEALERLSEGRTTFLITHDLRQAARADRILYLEGGCVRECGTHAELKQANGRYATLYRLQTVTGDHAPPEGPGPQKDEPHAVAL